MSSQGVNWPSCQIGKQEPYDPHPVLTLCWACDQRDVMDPTLKKLPVYGHTQRRV